MCVDGCDSTSLLHNTAPFLRPTELLPHPARPLPPVSIAT